jgi:Ni,Fe-hydrogenase III component G
MIARERLNQFRDKFGDAIERADLTGENRLFIFVRPSALKSICQHVFSELGARYVISIGADDRPYSGTFLIAHDFAFDRIDLLCSILAHVPPENPNVDSISGVVPAANWAEREIMDMVGIKMQGHPYPKRLVVPDGWPDGVYPLRKDFAWNQAPQGLRRPTPVQIRRSAPGLCRGPLRTFPSHPGRTGAFPALCRRRDGSRLRVSRVHGASRH